jgi:hypothetical protein
VQRELEVIGDHHNPAVVICDRGTIDGIAYWPGLPEEFWSSIGTTLERELARYDAVIHLQTPAAEQGYNHQNPLRTETAAAAAQIDVRIARAWESHPRRFIVASSSDFLEKAARAIAILRQELPECCKKHVVPVIDNRENRTTA